MYIIIAVQGCFPYVNIEQNEEGEAVVFSTEAKAEAYAEENCAWEYKVIKW